jgi:hypothetical protein
VKASDSRRLRRVLNAEPGGCRWSSTTPEPTTDEGARAQRGREPNRPPSAAVSAGREPSSLPCTPPYIFLLGRKKINRVGRRRPPPLHPLLPSAYVCRSLIVVSVEIRLSLNTARPRQSNPIVAAGCRAYNNWGELIACRCVRSNQPKRPPLDPRLPRRGATGRASQRPIKYFDAIDWAYCKRAWLRPGMIYVLFAGTSRRLAAASAGAVIHRAQRAGLQRRR